MRVREKNKTDENENESWGREKTFIRFGGTKLEEINKLLAGKKRQRGHAEQANNDKPLLGAL